jgi:hypothetical protein
MTPHGFAPRLSARSGTSWQEFLRTHAASTLIVPVLFQYDGIRHS